MLDLQAILLLMLSALQHKWLFNKPAQWRSTGVEMCGVDVRYGYNTGVHINVLNLETWLHNMTYNKTRCRNLAPHKNF
jgi:hypothetical protein